MKKGLCVDEGGLFVCAPLNIKLRISHVKVPLRLGSGGTSEE